MTRYVMALVEHHGSFITLLKKTGPESILGKLNGVGGKAGGDEAPVAAMNREWEEETGISMSFSNCCWGNLSGKGWEMFVFYKRADQRFALPEVNDAGEPLFWSSEYEMLEHGVPNLRWMIPMCRQKTFFHCWEWPL